MIDLKIPPPDFDENVYLSANPDVEREVRNGFLQSGWRHVLVSGHREERVGLPAAVKEQVRAHWANLEKQESDRTPPPALRLRVHGSTDYSGFFLVGDQVATDIDAALAAHHIALPEGAQVLDFGCGCGRVIDHVKQRHPGWSITGSDIDAEAIAWCRAHLGHIARFDVNRASPPLAADANTFDMVYAVSVFTHLPEKMQHAWLDELERVTKPSTTLLLSVLDFGFVPEAADASSRERGFVFLKTDRTEGLPDFYRSTIHTPEYVRREWSKYFDVLDVMPKRINAHQHLVVARTRQDTPESPRPRRPSGIGAWLRRLLAAR